MSAIIEGARIKRQDNIENDKICGPDAGISGLIVNGNDIPRGKFPWMVALMYLDDKNQQFFSCGASLISTQHVLTGELQESHFICCISSLSLNIFL